MSEKTKITFPKIILLSGTPGTGKTVISNLLLQKFNWQVFSLGNFVIDQNLYEKEDVERDTKVIDDEKASIEGFIEVLKITCSSSKRTDGNLIVVDSHYADIIIDGIDEIIENFENYLDRISKFMERQTCESYLEYFSQRNGIIGVILRCAPKILEKRLSKRDYKSEKVMENIQAEILSESTTNMLDVLGQNKIYEIDTTEISPDETSEIIYEIALNNENYLDNYRVGKINWMEKLANSGELDKYFGKNYGLKKEIDYDDI